MTSGPFYLVPERGTSVSPCGPYGTVLRRYECKLGGNHRRRGMASLRACLFAEGLGFHVGPLPTVHISMSSPPCLLICSILSSHALPPAWQLLGTARHLLTSRCCLAPLFAVHDHAIRARPHSGLARSWVEMR